MKDVLTSKICGASSKIVVAFRVQSDTCVGAKYTSDAMLWVV